MEPGAPFVQNLKIFVSRPTLENAKLLDKFSRSDAFHNSYLPGYDNIILNALFTTVAELDAR